MRGDSPVSDPSDGIECHARIIRQKNYREHGAQQAVARVTPEPRPRRRRMEKKADERIQDRPQHQGRNEPAPQQRRGREKPARQEEGHSRRRYQAAAQIVEDLPPVEGGKRVGFNPASAYRNARLQPVNDLPVATNPAVLPIPPRDVTARKDIQQLDVRRQPHADITAFQQIVTQQVRRWESFGQEAMKRVQFVDAFAVITAFSDQVLVNIGDGVRVGIDPARIGKNA